MDEVFRTFELHVLSRKRYPFLDPKVFNFEAIMKLFDTGCCYPLSERDEEGRRIILWQTRKFNTEIYSNHDAIRLITYVSNVLGEEEETQIAGTVFILDHRDITLKHIYTPVDALHLTELIKTCSTARQKGYYVVNMPKFALFFVDMFKSLLSEKLKKRLLVLKNQDELKGLINQDLLPKEYGGIRTELEMMQDFQEFELRNRDVIKKFYEFDIDWSRVPNESFKETESVGSFRKLEID